MSRFNLGDKVRFQKKFVKHLPKDRPYNVRYTVTALLEEEEAVEITSIEGQKELKGEEIVVVIGTKYLELVK